MPTRYRNMGVSSQVSTRFRLTYIGAMTRKARPKKTAMGNSTPMESALRKRSTRSWTMKYTKTMMSRYV
ncbi:MAG: hypothetical protein A4E29_00703 [Methanomassiliicoccales archaeon PtaB.Bin134]|nr:MAG: hypothetical protein A4E29_00703 [Methanomassiliicoccales archaeon PtaB.Bin134]